MIIEQLLHGYDNGHRLLAGSVLLKNKADMDLVATMSDWSEYVSYGGESSYVTAYPLVNSCYYVIAKTWYAFEMKRPGCVWTHSLLIPFDELNSIDDFKRLGTLFRRPDNEYCLDFYSSTIDYKNQNHTADDFRVLTVDRSLIGIVLNALVRAANDIVFFKALKDNRPIEVMLLAVMNVLPMAMLRRVSWCTGTAYTRKMNGIPLTCQFLSNISGLSTVDNAMTENQWQTYVIDALMRGDVNQGQLIRMFAEDIRESEKYYAAIVSVLYTLEDYFKTGKDSEERYKEVLSIIVDEFPKADEGTIIKKLCANKAFSDRYCQDHSFLLFFATLPLDGAFDIKEIMLDVRLRNFILNRRNEYVPLLSMICKSGSVNSWGESVLKDSVGLFTSEEIEGIIKGDFHLFSTITLLNARLLDSVQWMLLTPHEIEFILPLILDNRTTDAFTHWNVLFIALLEKGVEINDQLAGAIFTKITDATKILLDFVNKDTARYVNSVLGKQLEMRQEQVLMWLKSVDVITERVAYALVNSINENSSFVKISGPKLWIPFLGLRFHNLRAEVYAFLFSLSFNWPSDRDAIELMRMAFYPIHVLQANSQLGYSIWTRIVGNMEPVMFWDEWDNCKKLRKTVVKRLKRAGMDESVLFNFTPDEELNEMLLKMW